MLRNTQTNTTPIPITGTMENVVHKINANLDENIRKTCFKTNCLWYFEISFGFGCVDADPRRRLIVRYTFERVKNGATIGLDDVNSG